MPKIPDNPSEKRIREIFEQVTGELKDSIRLLMRDVQECREQVRILSAQHPFTPSTDDECSF